PTASSGRDEGGTGAAQPEAEASNELRPARQPGGQPANGRVAGGSLIAVDQFRGGKGERDGHLLPGEGRAAPQFIDGEVVEARGAFASLDRQGVGPHAGKGVGDLVEPRDGLPVP